MEVVEGCLSERWKQSLQKQRSPPVRENSRYGVSESLPPLTENKYRELVWNLKLALSNKNIMESLLSRAGSFSLLKACYKKVKKSIEKSRRKRLKNPAYTFAIPEEKILQTSRQLLDKTFRFSKLTPQEIEKPNKPGAFRGLLIPIPIDRIVHKALLNTVFPIFQKYIKQTPSYGVLEGRGVQKAFADLTESLRQGYQYVLVSDIQKFFNKIDRKILSKEIFKFLKDESVNYLIADILKVQFRFNPKDASLFPDENNGIPQGCSLSPLFADVFLKKFDLAMERSGYKMLRYIDDFIILCKSKREAYNAYRRARKILKTMSLNLDNYNDEKCKAKHLNELPEFLGVAFGPNSYFIPSKKKLLLFKRKLGNTVVRLSSKKIREETIEVINGMVRGWSGAYRMCDKTELQNCYNVLNTAIEQNLEAMWKRKQISQNERDYLKRSLLKFSYPTK